MSLRVGSEASHIMFPMRRGNYQLTYARKYNGFMARGWESKSVEAQQAEAMEKPGKARVKLTPEAAARTRERENFRLARRRVLQQLELSRDPRHRKLLEETLADLDQ